MKRLLAIASVIPVSIGCGDDTTSSGAESSSGVLSSSTETGSGSSSESGSSSGESSSSTTGPMPCASDEECTEVEAPFCGMSGECGTCVGTKDPDGACAGVDPLLPLCVGGACVACTPENPVVCDEQLLLCDGGTNACVPCTGHEQCGSGACELAVGTCFPPGTVVHVDDDGGQDFTSVSAAVASVGAGAHGVIVVHEIDDGTAYPSSTIDGGKVIALLSAPSEVPILQGTAGNPGLTVAGAGTVLYIDGLRVSQGTGLGMRVDDAFAWVDRSRIVQNSGGGVLAENGAELTLRNCFVGGASADVDAIAVNSSTLAMAYSTVGAGSVIVAQTRALYCENAATADVRNSILVSLDTMPEVVCPGVVVTNSASEAEVGFNATWFNGYATGDFSLSASGAMTFADVALWSNGDPATDIDGDPRPAADATPDYAGADVP